MTDATTDFAEWIGRREVTEDDLGLAPALAAAAMLDDTATHFAKRQPIAGIVALVLLSSQGAASAA